MTRVTTAHLEARKESILEAALKVFARKGIQSATMAEIAEDAGISAGAIYRYFTSKDALIEACFDENVEAMTAEWSRQVKLFDDPMEALIAISMHSFEQMETPDANDKTRVMIERTLDGSRLGDSEWRKQELEDRELIVRGLIEPLERAVEQGLFPKDIDLYQLGQSMLSFYFGARMARLLGEEIDTRAQLAAFCSLIGRASAMERLGIEIPEGTGS